MKSPMTYIKSSRRRLLFSEGNVFFFPFHLACLLPKLLGSVFLHFSCSQRRKRCFDELLGDMAKPSLCSQPGRSCFGIAGGSDPSPALRGCRSVRSPVGSCQSIPADAVAVLAKPSVGLSCVSQILLLDFSEAERLSSLPSLISPPLLSGASLPSLTCPGPHAGFSLPALKSPCGCVLSLLWCLCFFSQKPHGSFLTLILYVGA